MIDERGRGSKLPPKLENAAMQALCRAILEKAIVDKTCLADLGVSYTKVSDGYINLTEIKRFERSKWKDWLESQLTLTAVDANDAIERGHRMARNSRANMGKRSEGGCKKSPANLKYLYEYEGEMLSYWQIAKRAKLTAGEVQNRLQKGVPAEEAVRRARECRAKRGLPLEATKTR